jgi:hypothetical protein
MNDNYMVNGGCGHIHILLAVGDGIRGKGGKNRPATLDTLPPRSYIRRALSSGF